MIPPRDLQEGNFFRVRAGQLYKVLPEHLPQNNKIAAAVIPIELSTLELKNLGFSQVRPGEPTFEISYNGRTIAVKKASLNRWALLIAGEQYRYLQYVHELQNIFYHLFQDELQSFRKA